MTAKRSELSDLLRSMKQQDGSILIPAAVAENVIRICEIDEEMRALLRERLSMPSQSHRSSDPVLPDAESPP